MSDAFNGLTPAQAERLGMLVEECGEVIQIAGKILRHGYDSYHPNDPTTTNRHLLVLELRDVNAVLKAMARDELINANINTGVEDIWAKKLRYAHHQEADHE